mgnify:CR=1 FL=1
MNFSSDDRAVLEQALQYAASNSSDYQEIMMYEQLLTKLKSPSKSIAKDGFRYDYDDYRI